MMSYFVLQTLFWLLLSFILGLILGKWLKRLLCNRTKPELQGYSTDDSSARTSYSGTADKLAFRDKGEHIPETNQRSGISAGTATTGIATAAVAGAVSRSLSNSDDETETETATETANVDVDDVDTASIIIDESIEIEQQVADITLEGESDSSLSESTPIDAEIVTDVDSDTDVSIRKTPQTELDSTSENKSIDVTFGSDTSDIEVKTNIEADIETDAETVISGDADNTTGESSQTEIDITWKDDNDDTTRTNDTIESTDDDELLAKAASTMGTAGVAAGIVSAVNDTDVEEVDGEDNNEIIEDATNKAEKTSSEVNKTVEVTRSESTISGLDSDNLQIIEGIGPKMQEILHANGVHDWKSLSLKSETDLRGILDLYDDKYKGVEGLDSWASQAKLAANGDIDELIRVQKVDGISKVENKFGITGSEGNSGGNKESTNNSKSVSNDAEAKPTTEEASSGKTAITGVAAAIAGTATAQGLMGSADTDGSSNNSDSSSTSSSSGIPGIDSDENLQIIEGIGPAMEKVLKENGIHNWSDLGSQSEADVQAILDSYGDKYKLMQPASWITEAKLAAAGDVNELIRIQKVDGISKLEKLMGNNANSGFGGYQKNDLQIVEGIGPKISILLNKAGINSWKALANTDVRALQSILDAGGEDFQMANPATWAEQAAMAQHEDWSELKTYQDFLEGGVDPSTITAARGLAGSTDNATSSKIPGIDADTHLQIIEGIGPAMEKVLNENGINSWSDLGSQSEADVQAILDNYGDKYKLMQPASWIVEAKLAAAGDVTELIRIQKVDGISKLEKLIGASDKSGFGAYQQDDLQIVEGIGPKIAELLNNSGINSWKVLSNSKVEKLQGILDAAGSNFQIADPSTWAEQASLADKGEWADLKKYQDFLDGGRAV